MREIFTAVVSDLQRGPDQRCTEFEIFDSDSTPASAEYTPTPKHF